MQPIETIYKGYKFRSRLEARWAVFFDTIGIKFHYELEGFQLEHQRYLPDFYLPNFFGGCYVEVKPDIPEGPAKEKVLAFRQEVSDLFLAIGDPATYRGLYYILKPVDKPRTLTLLRFAYDQSRKLVCLFDRSLGVLLLNSFSDMANLSDFEQSDTIINNQFLEEAFLTARQARFEHHSIG